MNVFFSYINGFPNIYDTSYSEGSNVTIHRNHFPMEAAVIFHTIHPFHFYRTRPYPIFCVMLNSL